MKGIIPLSVFLVVLTFCSNKRDSYSVVKFSQATAIEITEQEQTLADNSLLNSIPLKDVVGKQYVYVVNPECSFCIARAIDCCNAWYKNDKETPFIFLIKSDYSELFEFYLNRDCKKKVPFITSCETLELSDGLYTISNSHVCSYSSWNP